MAEDFVGGGVAPKEGRTAEPLPVGAAAYPADTPDWLGCSVERRSGPALASYGEAKVLPDQRFQGVGLAETRQRSAIVGRSGRRTMDLQ